MESRSEEELGKCLDRLRPGDTLVVPSVGRLGRSIQDLISIVAERESAGSASSHARIPGHDHARRALGFPRVRRAG
ncbi:recombinase family protein [Streptomyces sp. NPDC056637]|uniref:recombinase family protein n=1 Tax=unclassified Streptomyces TaxID=2593676 RepID=UPI0036692F7F